MLNNFIQNILDKIQGNSWGEGGVVYSKDIYERPIPFSIIIRRNNMKKAILVGDYASVEALNKLLEQGYTVESVDDRGVYILKRDELKAEPIKITINLDTKAIKKSIEKTVKQIRNMKDVIENVSKQTNVRIEFDHINDVPEIYIDGKKVTDGLVSLNIDWKTNTESISEKSFEIKLVNKDGYETTIGENSLF